MSHRLDDLPLVSVIIPVLDQDDGLRRCLAALSDQTYPADRIEILVVDNGSRVPARLVPFPGIRHLTETRPGSYAARNRGIADARGDVYAFTDADCVPARDWIERGVAAIHDLAGDGMAGGRIEVRVRDRDRPTTAELVESVLAFPQEAYIKAGFAATANLFTTRTTFERTGLFDDSLMSGGDVEWGDRVRALGLPQRYAEKAVVAHDARLTLRALCRKSRRVAGGVQRLAQRRGRGAAAIFRHARQQLIDLRKIRAHMSDQRLGTFARKCRFGAAVWFVELLHTLERCRVQLGGTPSRV